MQTSQLSCDANRMTAFWGGIGILRELLDKLYVSTYNYRPLRFSLSTALQAMAEGFANGSPPCIFQKFSKISWIMHVLMEWGLTGSICL